MFPRRGSDRYQLVIGMTGVKMGDRVLQIGCAHAGRLGAIASKVGLSGQSTAVVPDEPSAARARAGAAKAGALVDVEIGTPTRLPVADAAFDLAVLDDHGGLFTNLDIRDRTAAVRETLRALRPGGRALVIGAVPRSGFAALIARQASPPSTDLAPLLEGAGFRSVRRLAERDGLSFTEGIKPR